MGENGYFLCTYFVYLIHLNFRAPAIFAHPNFRPLIFAQLLNFAPINFRAAKIELFFIQADMSYFDILVYYTVIVKEWYGSCDSISFKRPQTPSLSAHEPHPSASLWSAPILTTLAPRSRGTLGYENRDKKRISPKTARMP